MNYIDLNTDFKTLTNFLLEIDFLTDGETISSVEKPGEGNMNVVIRVITNKRSFIVKQSRDYVQKYPQVAAPLERVLREAEFYEEIKTYPELSTMIPNLIGLDTKNSIMLMDDLGDGSDFASLYQEGNTISEQELKTVVDFIGNLHTSVTIKNGAKKITNRKMRALNYEHIFNYPYLEDNGINLDDILPGLKAAANFIKQDKTLKKEVIALGDRYYLQDGETLLHGDYFPGSWLKTASGIKIIDPEFCFFGIPEFEVGVLIAHLKMANQSEELIDKVTGFYKEHNSLNTDLTFKFVGIEMIRRIIGLAQLPLTISLEKRIALLKEGKNYII